MNATAFHERHRVVRKSAGNASRVKRYDVGMLKLGSEADLASKPFGAKLIPKVEGLGHHPSCDENGLL